MKKIPAIVLSVFIVLCSSIIYAKFLKTAGLCADAISDGTMTYYANKPSAGYVSAYDLKKHEPAWEVQAYEVIYDKNLEEDAQWVFITDMKLKKGVLTVVNSRNQKFRINAKSGRLIGKKGIIDNRGRGEDAVKHKKGILWEK